MSTAATPTPSTDQARELVDTVITILEKLHAEGFLAGGVFQNLGLTKARSALTQPPGSEQLQTLDAFVKRIDVLFASKALLHPSATEKFQTLFSGHLRAATRACQAAISEGSKP